MSAVEYIAGTTLTAVTSEVSFTSIPGTYTELLLTAVGSLNNTGQVWVYVNSDFAATNYSQTRINGNGSSVSSARLSSKATWEITSANETIANNRFTFSLSIASYSSSSIFKTALWLYGEPATQVISGVGLWRNTSPITHFAVNTFNTQQFSVGTTMSLWGVK